MSESKCPVCEESLDGFSRQHDSIAMQVGFLQTSNSVGGMRSMTVCPGCSTALTYQDKMFVQITPEQQSGWPSRKQEEAMTKLRKKAN